MEAAVERSAVDRRPSSSRLRILHSGKRRHGEVAQQVAGPQGEVLTTPQQKPRAPLTPVVTPPPPSPLFRCCRPRLLSTSRRVGADLGRPAPHSGTASARSASAVASIRLPSGHRHGLRQHGFVDSCHSKPVSLLLQPHTLRYRWNAPPNRRVGLLCNFIQPSIECWSPRLDVLPIPSRSASAGFLCGMRSIAILRVSNCLECGSAAAAPPFTCASIRAPPSPTPCRSRLRGALRHAWRCRRCRLWAPPISRLFAIQEYSLPMSVTCVAPAGIPRLLALNRSLSARTWDFQTCPFQRSPHEGSRFAGSRKPPPTRRRVPVAADRSHPGTGAAAWEVASRPPASHRPCASPFATANP